MKRIDTADAEADKFGTGKDGFTNGNPDTSDPPTVVDADWLDSAQEEIANAIETSWASALAPAVLRQLSAGLRRTTINHNESSTPAAAYAGTIHGIAMDTGGVWCFVGTAAGIQTGGLSAQKSITWTARTAGSSYAGSFYDVIWSSVASLFIAVGSGEEIQTAPAGGATWTRRNNATNDLNALTENGSIVVAVGNSGGIFTSTNGTTWTARTAAGSYTGNFEGVAWNGTVFVAVGDDGEVQTSSDGITWASQGVADASGFAAVAADTHTGTLVATTFAAEFYRSTDDGATWDLEATYNGGGNPFVVICTESLWIAGGSNSILFTSIDDGQTWVVAELELTSAGEIHALHWPDGSFRYLPDAGIASRDMLIVGGQSGELQRTYR